MDQKQAGELTDIHQMVFAIKENQHRQDVRITRLEVDLDATKKANTEVHSRLDQRINGIHSLISAVDSKIDKVADVLTDHTKQEDKDRRAMILQLWTILIGVGIGVIGFIAQWVMSK